MKKIIRYFGFLVTIVCFIFIIKTLFSFDIDYTILFNLKNIFYIIALSLFFSVNIFLNNIAWNKIINLFSSKKIKISETYKIYSAANIGKYLPGNIGHYAGRNIIGQKYNISQKDMAISSIFEIFLKLFNAFILIILLIGNNLLVILDQLKTNFNFDTNVILFILISITLIFVLLIIYYLSPLINRHRDKQNIDLPFSKKCKTLLINSFIYLFVFIINIIVFLLVIQLFSPVSIKSDIFSYISAAYILSWLMGFITPGVPGGIGVKEGVLIFLLSSSLSPELISLVSIVVRIISIFADIIGYIIGKQVKIVNL